MEDQIEARRAARTADEGSGTDIAVWLAQNAERRWNSFQLQWGSSPFGWTTRLPFGPSYRIPRRLESSHVMLMGDIGSGKSSAIKQILRQVQERGETAIAYDTAMDFVGEFYDRERAT